MANVTNERSDSLEFKAQGTVYIKPFTATSSADFQIYALIEAGMGLDSLALSPMFTAG